MTASFLTEFALDALAVHRLTRLVTDDELTRPWRDKTVEHAYVHGRWLGGRTDLRTEELAAAVATGVIDWSEAVEQDDNPPKVATLVTCRWCASVWIAAGVLVARRVAPSWWAPAARLLALSSVSTLLATVER